jgi:F0F1-type ATP synthase assembly protein I
MGTGWGITATMIAGPLVWGGVGYLVDRLIGTAHVFAAIGIVVGAACATYIVYLRYGKEDRGES